MGKKRRLTKGEAPTKVETTLKELTIYSSKLIYFLLKYKYLVSKYNHTMSPTFHGLSLKELYKHNHYSKLSVRYV